MAAKGIATGIEHLAAQKRASEKHSVQLSKQWKEIRNRIDATLMANNVMKTNDVRAKCFAIDQMTPEARIAYITENWGPLYLQRVTPLLQQLANLEQQLLRAG